MSGLKFCFDVTFIIDDKWASVKHALSEVLFCFTSVCGCSHVLQNITHTLIWRADRIVLLNRAAGKCKNTVFLLVLNYTANLSLQLSVFIPFIRFRTWRISVFCFTILDAFTKLRKATVSFVVSFCLPAWSNSASTGPILIKLYIWVFFVETVEKIQVLLKSDKNNEYFIWKRLYIYDNISLNYCYNEKLFG